MCRDALTGCRSSSDTVLANHNILRRCPHCAVIEVRVGVGFVFFSILFFSILFFSMAKVSYTVHASCIL